MSMRRTTVPWMAVWLAAWRVTAADCVRELPIINPGFEEVSRPLAVGEITNGAGGAGVAVGTRASFFASPQFEDTVEVAGWRTFLPPPNNPTATIRAGAMRPPIFGMTPFLNGYSGVHVASLQNASMQQTLPVPLEPDTRYELTFLAGFGVGTTPEGVYVALLAVPDLESVYFRNTPGAHVLAQTQGVFFLPGDEGEMLPHALEYTTPATLPESLNGRYIAISFVGSDGIPITNYDDFRLTAESLGRRDCVGDVNGDDAVDVDDLNMILSNWRMTVGVCSSLDAANGDGVVDVDDLNAVLGNWQGSCGAGPA